MRAHRKPYASLTAEQKRRANCRSYTKVLQSRGLLAKGACERCGKPAENHHPDYENPRLFNRLCRDCHLEAHAHG